MARLVEELSKIGGLDDQWDPIKSRMRRLSEDPATRSPKALEGVLSDISRLGARQLDILKKRGHVSLALARLARVKMPLRELESRLKTWTKQSTRDNWLPLAKEIQVQAKRRGVTSIVTFKTRPKSRATIKYQSLDDREKKRRPMTANSLTTCHQKLWIGFYYIWSERNGKPTSSVNDIRPIIGREQEVEIAEHRTPDIGHQNAMERALAVSAYHEFVIQLVQQHCRHVAHAFAQRKHGGGRTQ